MISRTLPTWLSAAVLALYSVSALRAADSTGLVPLDDLGPTRTYRGLPGGLYPQGNEIPSEHLAAGLLEAEEIRPRDCQGRLDPAGAIGVVSVGMSNTSFEWRAFMELASRQSDLASSLVLVNGALGGQDASKIAPADAPYWDHLLGVVRQNGLDPRQVQAAWFLEAKASPRGGFPASAELLQDLERAALRNLRDRFPNLRIVFMSSRVYAGYARTPLNPEPFAYEGAFATKWLVEEQIRGDPRLNFEGSRGEVESAWLTWAAYTWADGLRPRGDGLVWRREDFEADGTHPSDTGSAKVAELLLDAFHRHPAAAWMFQDADASLEPPLGSVAGCGQPSDLPYSPKLEESGPGALRLTWRADADPAAFRVEARTPLSPFETLVEVGGQEREATLTGLEPATYYEVRVRALASGGGDSLSESVAATTQGVAAPCEADAFRLCLADGRFRAQLLWRTSDGRSGEGRTRLLTPESGAFYFFDEANLELVVKVLDGRVVNGSFWVFFGSLTDVELYLTVVDSQSGAAKTYLHPQGTLAGTGDTGAFPVGAAAATRGDVGARLPRLATTSPPPCASSSPALCLQDGRFLATLEWGDSQSGGLPGRSLHLTPDTGAFTFFSEDNVELAVKLLDGRGVNGHFWLFVASLTDVAFELTITDTESGEEKTWSQAAEGFVSFADLEAF